MKFNALDLSEPLLKVVEEPPARKSWLAAEPTFAGGARKEVSSPTKTSEQEALHAS